jgi:TIR domain
MPISQRSLRGAASRASHKAVAKSLNEAISKSKQTAFLCHSHKDQMLAKGLQTLLVEDGWDVYIDWEDEEMPPSPTKETANNIKNKIKQVDWFLFLATPNSTGSRWCPWEIGYADAVKVNEKILIVPTSDDSGRWYGNEYLQLYRKIDEAINKTLGLSGYAVFSPGQDSGATWVSGL